MSQYYKEVRRISRSYPYFYRSNFKPGYYIDIRGRVILLTQDWGHLDKKFTRMLKPVIVGWYVNRTMN
jgi:hypothetical protein